MLSNVCSDGTVIGKSAINARSDSLTANVSPQSQFLVVKHNFISSKTRFPVGIYLLKVDDRNIITRCKICSQLTIRTPERRQWRPCGVFVVSFEYISHLVLLFLLLTLNM